MTLSVDFDGVIHDWRNRSTGKRMGEPMNGAIDALDLIYEQGHKIIIYTVKASTPAGKEAVADWLDYFNIEYHDITATKPNADYYLDDRAIRFIDWDSALTSLGIEEDD